MLQAMHASNARARCRYGRTDGLTESLPTSQGHLTFRNARAHIQRFPSAKSGAER